METQPVVFEEMSIEQIIKKIRRTIISDKPRVTKFNIDWSQKLVKRKQPEDSQSKLEDFFSISSRSKKDEEDSNSQKIN